MTSGRVQRATGSLFACLAVLGLGTALVVATPQPASADPAWDALQAAFSTASPGATITLSQDVTGDPGEGLIVPNGQSLTLDLAGHTLDIDATGAVGVPGIRVVGASTSLTIEDSSPAGGGHLLARADPGFGNGGAGIGAPGATPGTGSVTITGGTVEAYGGYQAAGIGGANYGGGAVTVTGGDVTAIGGFTGSGIGGGWSGGGGTLDIGGSPYPSGQVADGGGSTSSAGAPITTISGTPGLEYLATRAGTGNSIRIRFGHTLSFDANGGGPTPPAQFVPLRTAPVPPVAPTRAYYDFAAWEVAAPPAAAYDFTAPLGAATTAYAAWTPVSYALSYDLAGGTVSTANPTAYDIASPAFTLANPTRHGYAFAGWTGTGLGAATTSVTVPLGSTGDRSYTATWSSLPPTPRPPAPPGPPVPTPVPSPAPSPTPTTSPEPTPTPTVTVTAVPVAPADASPLPPDAARPSTLTDSTLTFGELPRLPDRLPLAIAATVVWILLLIFLVRTLADTLRDRLEHWSERFGRRHPRLAGGVRRVTGWLNGTGPIPIAITFAASSCIMWAVESGHRDDAVAALGPASGSAAAEGFEQGLRVLGSAAIAVLVITIVTRLLTALIARAAWGIRATPHASGWAIVVGLLGLALSRALNFIPGLLEGSSMSLRRDTATRQRDFARVEALHGWVSLALSLLGWVGANLVPATGDWQTLLVHDALVAIAVAGLGSLLVELVPIRTLAGGAMWAHARRQWLALTVLSGVAFVLIVIPDASNWITIHDTLTRWIAIAVTFAIAALVVILALNVRAAHHGGEAEED